MEPTRIGWSALAVMLVAVAGLSAIAHPGVGIVEDTHGSIFYTDLESVWRIAADGTKSLAVSGVHTHELCIDAHDTLYGEHLWYEGDATKTWRHRVWERTSDGVVRDVRWMTVTPDGIVYLVDTGRLLRVGAGGKVAVVVAALSAKEPPPAKVGDPHYQGGLWTGAKGSVYVAVPEERLVLEVKADGATRVAARARFPWAPYGGMVDRAGNLWLLETSAINAVRVRKIGKDGIASR